ncbi:MAG: RNA-binding S4 domain-containing protein [Bacillota bacterium]
MRLDKFLKVSRLVRRRTVANKMCAAGLVTLNGRVARPAAEVRPGDIIGITFGTRTIEVEVAKTPDSVPASEAASLYRLLRGGS